MRRRVLNWTFILKGFRRSRWVWVEFFLPTCSCAWNSFGWIFSVFGKSAVGVFFYPKSRTSAVWRENTEFSHRKQPLTPSFLAPLRVFSGSSWWSEGEKRRSSAGSRGTSWENEAARPDHRGPQLVRRSHWAGSRRSCSAVCSGGGSGEPVEVRWG